MNPTNDNMEYCSYILGINRNSLAMIDPASSYDKDAFLTELDSFLRSGPAVNRDALLLDAFSLALDKGAAFLQKKPDQQMRNFYQITCHRLKLEEAGVKRGDSLNYEEMFEIGCHICRMLASAAQGIGGKGSPVTFSVKDDDIPAALAMLASHLNISASGALPSPVGARVQKLGKAKLPIRLPVFAQGGKLSPSVYLIYALLATEMRNEELKGAYGNGW